MGSHLQIDPAGELWSDPPGGGCHAITTVHRDISQHVFPLLLGGAFAIGLKATQRNNSITRLHPLTVLPPCWLCPVTAYAQFSLGLSPDLTGELPGDTEPILLPRAVCFVKPKRWMLRNWFLHYLTEQLRRNRHVKINTNQMISAAPR